MQQIINNLKTVYVRKVLQTEKMKLHILFVGPVFFLRTVRLERS